MQCSACHLEIPEDARFCSGCGREILRKKDMSKSSDQEGERKHATVLFSDLSGYTALSERLDPEEVKEIMGDIFGEIAAAVDRYGGFIEKYIGDAVMAVFGVPHTHEDDPIRAVHTALEILRIMEHKRPALMQKTGHSLSMHTGINTGLVVTGNIDLEKGTHGVFGDTVNVAARLSSIAGPDQIVVDQKTFSMAREFFNFQEQPPAALKGKKEKVRTYLVLSLKPQAQKVHRSQGWRADFIGRTAEMESLLSAVQALSLGKGSVAEILGEAGTGKSRLVEELKKKTDPSRVQWLEAHSFSFSQNVSYAPWANLFRRAFTVEDASAPDAAREKLEAGITRLQLDPSAVAPYIGALLSIPYPIIDEMSPEFFKERLQDSVIQVLRALSFEKPAIFCFEDLHWADASSIDMLKTAAARVESPSLFLCIYRPVIALFSPGDLAGSIPEHQRIHIRDLSPAEAEDMLCSMLGGAEIPPDLLDFVRGKAEGNPFYLEEVINELMDSGVLTRDKTGLRVSRSLSRVTVPATIQEVISARLDRLEAETKQILQEASVIGKSFWMTLLHRITRLKEHLDTGIDRLEGLDLIRYHASEPDLTYIFKHALTQEVAYNGLLKKLRREIHEKVAAAMEALFAERLGEFYEALAFHYSRGESVQKAVEYLVKSGEKSLKFYALKESHAFFSQAYALICSVAPRGEAERETLIHTLNKWASVFYFTGDVNGLMALLKTHEVDADRLTNAAVQGMFYAWYGWALGMQEHVQDSFRYLYKALAIGEQTGDQLIIGYACTWLVFSCFEELLNEGLTYGTRAHQIAHEHEPDPYLYFKSLCGLGHLHFMKGEGYKSYEIGQRLLTYGRANANVRCLTVGHLCLGYAHAHTGRFAEAVNCYRDAIETSRDPIYANWARCFLGMAYLSDNRFPEAEAAFSEVVSFSDKYGCGILGTMAQAALGVVVIDKGEMGKGMEMLSEALKTSEKNNRTWVNAFAHYLTGKVYLQIVEKRKPLSLGTILKNIGFIVKTVPGAAKKAESHFSRAIALFEKMDARGLLGHVHVDMALLKKAKGNGKAARRHLESANALQENQEKRRCAFHTGFWVHAASPEKRDPGRRKDR
ncbi:MAG: AAA family ATPase [Deltaproteobacteria bacterium]|nr:AAA family ATPase [Deltaproteobacteria bacterium]